MSSFFTCEEYGHDSELDMVGHALYSLEPLAPIGLAIVNGKALHENSVAEIWHLAKVSIGLAFQTVYLLCGKRIIYLITAATGCL